MVTLLHVIVVAVVQGITEFLPISSSGHLVLIPAVTGWPDQGVQVDVAAHVGSLGAVFLYFRQDIGALIVGLFRALVFRPDAGARMLGLLIIATVPAVAAGAALAAVAPDLFRNTTVIAWTMTVGAVLLYAADQLGLRIKRIEHMGASEALAIGLAQALALIPGTSRAGITMTAARIFGFERREAARFSMLLSIPVIIGAGILSGAQLIERGDPVLTGAAVLAAAFSFVAAWAAIAILMRWLQDASFTPLVIYRLLLGCGLLWWVYT